MITEVRYEAYVCSADPTHVHEQRFGSGLPPGWVSYEIRMHEDGEIKVETTHFCSSRCADAFEASPSQQPEGVLVSKDWLRSLIKAIVSWEARGGRGERTHQTLVDLKNEAEWALSGKAAL